MPATATKINTRKEHGRQIVALMLSSIEAALMSQQPFFTTLIWQIMKRD